MSKISNIILRNHYSCNNKRSKSSNQPEYSISNPNPHDEKLKLINSTLINSNTSVIRQGNRKKTLSLSSNIEIVPTYTPIVLEQDSFISQTFITSKHYDYGSIPIQSYDIPLLNSSSFCYANEPRGGVVSLSSSSNKTIPNNTSSTFKSRKNNRSLTEIKGRNHDYRNSTIDHNANYTSKQKAIRDDMRHVWLKEVSISTGDSFDIDSISNEIEFPKKDWIYLEVIDNQISFYYNTIHINEQLANQKKDNNIDFSIIQSIKEKEKEMPYNLQIISFDNEIIGKESVIKPNLPKTRTILKIAPRQFKSKRKQNIICNNEDDYRDYVDNFNYKIINPSNIERWNYTNEIISNNQLEFNLINNANDNESNSNSYDQYFFIHQRKDVIISKILISSLQMKNESSSSNLFHSNCNPYPKSSFIINTLDSFSILSSLSKELITQSQIDLHLQILSPHLAKSDSFSFYSLIPLKKWDPVRMRKENQERIDYIVEKTILLRTNNNRHIKEVYKMEYDEIVEDEEINIMKSKVRQTNNNLKQSYQIKETLYGIPLYYKWNDNNRHKQIEYFTIKNKGLKWNNKLLYPIQVTSVSFKNKSNNYNNNIAIINQSNGQDVNNILLETANFTFNSDQESLNHNKEKSNKINQYGLSNDSNKKSYLANMDEEEKLIERMKNRWNNNNELYQGINYNLIQLPLSALFQCEYDNNVEILQTRKAKAIKKNVTIPYQAINFHFKSLPCIYDYTNENQMEFILKTKQKEKKTINELTLSEPIIIEYTAIKKKRKGKLKKVKEIDQEEKKTDKEKNNNDIKGNDTIVILEYNEKENEQKIEEDYFNNNNNNSNNEIVIKDSIEVEDKDKKQFESKNNQVLKNKKRNITENNKQSNSMQFDKSQLLTISHKKNNQLFSSASFNKNCGDTLISKQKEKKKPLPIKPTNHDFTIYTKDQGIQRIKTNKTNVP